MNKKISTRAGIIVGIFIFGFILLLRRLNIEAQSSSPIILLQFLFLFLGIVGSCFMLSKYYDAISMMDYFKHCLRTLATSIVLIVFGTIALFFILRTDGEPSSNLTIIVGYTIFAYTISGLMSSLIASFIFNTFAKKK
jgi:hypothetical protein